MYKENTRKRMTLVICEKSREAQAVSLAKERCNAVVKLVLLDRTMDHTEGYSATTVDPALISDIKSSIYKTINSPPTTEIVDVLLAISGSNIKQELINIINTNNQTQLIGAISKTASISKLANIHNTVIADQAVVIQTNAKINSHCFLETSCSIDHDCEIGSNTIIGAKATLCGHVSVGEDCIIGSAAVVVPSVRIGNGAVVKPASVVIDDVPPNTVVYGNPATFFKKV